MDNYEHIHTASDKHLAEMVEFTADHYSQTMTHEENETLREAVRRLAAHQHHEPFNSEQEPVSEDLEEEIENYIKDSIAIKFPTTDKEQIKADIRYIARRFAHWQHGKDFDDLLQSEMKFPKEYYDRGKADAMKEMKEVLQTEYEKGRFDMREEIMQNIVESVSCTYSNQSGTFLHIKY